MSDTVEITIRRPLRARTLERLAERAAEVLSLTTEATGDEEEPSYTVPTPEEIMAALEIKAVFSVVTRRQAARRGDLREDTLSWMEEATGKKRLDISVANEDPEIANEFVIRMQACDIIGCIELQQCKGIEFGDEPPAWFDGVPAWRATADPADWVDCKDWLFSALLGGAWDANPQWSLAAGAVPFD